MCFLFKFSKYILLRIITESLGCKDLLLLDCSLTNYDKRRCFLELMKDYSQLFQKQFFATIRMSKFTPLVIQYAASRKFDFDRIVFVLSEKSSTYQMTSIPNTPTVSTELNTACLQEIKSLRVLGKGTNAISTQMEFFPNLLTLVTADYHRFDTVGQYCHNLRHIDVISQHTTVLRLDEVLRHCKQLTHFGWYHAGLGASYIPVIQALVVHGSALTSIKLSTKYIGQYAMNLFALHSLQNRLERIRMEPTTDFNLMKVLWYRGEILQSLSLEMFNSTSIRPTFKDIRRIGLACPILTDLSLIGYLWIDDEAIIEILRGLPSLLTLSGRIESTCPEVTRAYAKCQSLVCLNFPPMWLLEEVQSIEFRWSNMTVLQMFCCESVPYILKHCIQLKDLTLYSGVSRVASRAVAPPNLSEIVKVLPSIHILDIARLAFWITGGLLTEVYTMCRQLRELYCGTFEGRDQFKVLVGSRFYVWRYRVKDGLKQEKTIR